MRYMAILLFQGNKYKTRNYKFFTFLCSYQSTSYFTFELIVIMKHLIIMLYLVIFKKTALLLYFPIPYNFCVCKIDIPATYINLFAIPLGWQMKVGL